MEANPFRVGEVVAVWAFNPAATAPLTDYKEVSMMRALLLLVVVLALVPAEVDSKMLMPRWQQRRVVVYDYAGLDWGMQQAVAHFNEMLPKRAPNLIYVAMSGPCQRNTRAISVCVIPPEQMDPGAVGQAPQRIRWGRELITRAEISFAAGTRVAGYGLACHELFHAMGGGADGSWVYASPCPYDDAIMQDIYKREKRHRHR